MASVCISATSLVAIVADESGILYSLVQVSHNHVQGAIGTDSDGRTCATIETASKADG